MTDERWRLTCAREELAALRSEPAFQPLLRVARAANALRFGIAVLTEGREDGTPALRRRRLNAYLQLAGTVHEALRLAQALERTFGATAGFATGFGALLADAGAMAYAEEALGELYVRAPFAFGGSPAATAANTPRLPPPGHDAVFGEGQGKVPGAFYYSLADEALLAAVLDIEAAPGAPFYDAMKEHMESAALLAERCAEAADRLVAELLRAQPWRLATGPARPVAGAGEASPPAGGGANSGDQQVREQRGDAEE